jgi:hypothetical protein
MGSLIEELAAREAAARVRVGELEAEIAELASRLEAERETLSRLVITRETVAEVMAETSLQEAEEETEETVQPAAVAAAASSSPFAGAEARVIGVLTVPRWQPGLGVEVLPKTYRDIVEVVADAPGPVRAKQIVPRVGLPAETAKIEGTRSKLKRLVERAGWTRTRRGCSPRPAAAGGNRRTPGRSGALLPTFEGANLFEPAKRRARMEPYDTTATVDPFARSKELFESLMGMLSGGEAAALTHAELEERLDARGRELLRQLMQDHLDLRAIREEERARRGQAPPVAGGDGRPRPHRESGHSRLLACLFGLVRVHRLAYRQKGLRNVYPADRQLALPADRQLALPAGRHSLGLRRLAVLEAVRGSYDHAAAVIERRCGKCSASGSSNNS